MTTINKDRWQQQSTRLDYNDGQQWKDDNGNNTRLQCCAFQKWLPWQFVCVCVSWRFFAEAEGAIHWWSVLRGIGQRRVESRQDSLNDMGWWAKAAACWQPKILNKTCSYFDLCFSGLLDYCCAHQLVAMDFTVAFKRIPCPQQTLGLSPIDGKAIISNQMRQSALTSMKVRKHVESSRWSLWCPSHQARTAGDRLRCTFVQFISKLKQLACCRTW